MPLPGMGGTGGRAASARRKKCRPYAPSSASMETQSSFSMLAGETEALNPTGGENRAPVVAQRWASDWHPAAFDAGAS
jgi:hypothetical protein